MQEFYPAVIEGSDAEGYAVEVIGAGVNGQGDTRRDALRNAAEILQQVIDDAVQDGEPVPTPGEITEADQARGHVALLQATLPAAAA